MEGLSHNREPAERNRGSRSVGRLKDRPPPYQRAFLDPRGERRLIRAPKRAMARSVFPWVGECQRQSSCFVLWRGSGRLGSDLHFVTVGEIHRWLKDDLVAVLDALADLNLGALIGGDRNLAKMGDAVLDDRDLHAVLIED